MSLPQHGFRSDKHSLRTVSRIKPWDASETYRAFGVLKGEVVNLCYGKPLYKNLGNAQEAVKKYTQGWVVSNTGTVLYIHGFDKQLAKAASLIQQRFCA